MSSRRDVLFLILGGFFLTNAILGEVIGGKLFFLGKLPVNIQSQAYYFVEKPDFGPDWQLRFQVQFLFPLPGS